MHEMLCFAGQNVSWKMFVWGSLSGGRVRDGPGYARIMVGSVPHWNCEFRLHFHSLNLQNLKEVSHDSFVFTSSTFRFSKFEHVLTCFNC